MAKFKKGDLCRMRVKIYPDVEVGDIVRIEEDSSLYPWILPTKKGIPYSQHWHCPNERSMELVTSVTSGSTIGGGSDGSSKFGIIKKNNIIQIMFETFKSLFVKEPIKSYRALSITDQNDKPTKEGIELVVSWIINHKVYGSEFVKDVVNPLKEDKEKNKK